MPGPTRARRSSAGVRAPRGGPSRSTRASPPSPSPSATGRAESMGHKVHPYGFRLGVTRTWTAKWYHDKEYTALLTEDIFIRKLVEKRLPKAGGRGLRHQRHIGHGHAA